MVTLTNVGTAYDTIAASKGLGIQDVDFTGVTQVVFRARWNKIGSGVLSWQLWDETDGTEVARLDDAIAGDNKTASIIAGVSKTGIHTLRVRAKSTVAGDDPVFYGASVLLVRP